MKSSGGVDKGTLVRFDSTKAGPGFPQAASMLNETRPWFRAPAFSWLTTPSPPIILRFEHGSRQRLQTGPRADNRKLIMNTVKKHSPLSRAPVRVDYHTQTIHACAWHPGIDALVKRARVGAALSWPVSHGICAKCAVHFGKGSA